MMLLGMNKQWQAVIFSIKIIFLKIPSRIFPLLEVNHDKASLFNFTLHSR